VAVATATTTPHQLASWKPGFCTLEAVTPPMAALNATSACVDEGLVAIETRCIVCRIDRSEQLVGVIAEMSTEQLQSAQKLAGLPTSPVLATEREWKDAIAQKRKLLPPTP
jgi:hypothetical protein